MDALAIVALALSITEQSRGGVGKKGEGKT
jgi:hypothetical protein